MRAIHFPSGVIAFEPEPGDSIGRNDLLALSKAGWDEELLKAIEPTVNSLRTGHPTSRPVPPELDSEG